VELKVVKGNCRGESVALPDAHGANGVPIPPELVGGFLQRPVVKRVGAASFRASSSGHESGGGVFCRQFSDESNQVEVIRAVV
jgi:hypothetical protein